MREEKVIKFSGMVLALVCICVLVQTGMVCKAEEKADWKEEFIEEDAATFRFPGDWHLFVNGQTYDESEYEACGVEESDISSFFDSEYMKILAVQEQTDNWASIMIMDTMGLQIDYKDRSDSTLDSYREGLVKGFGKSYSEFADTEFREYYTGKNARFIVMDVYLKDTDQRAMVIYETVYNGKDVVVCLQGTEDFFRQEAYIESIVDEIHIEDTESAESAVSQLMNIVGYIQGTAICCVIIIAIIVVIVVGCIKAGKKKSKK